VVPGGSKRNAEYFGKWVEWGGGVEPWLRTLLCDAQTSGGLLASVKDGARLLAALADRGVTGAVIGRLENGEPGRLIIA
jgi:selenide,water dikinase